MTKALLKVLTMTSILATAPAFAGQNNDLADLSTTFDSPAALDGWQNHIVDGFTAKWAEPRVEGGALILEPSSSGWFEDMQAGHLYREVTGPFVVTARVQVEGTEATLPQTLFSLGGLFVRAPKPDLTAASWAPGEENWMFFALGSAFPAGSPQFEVKTTYDSLSTLKIHDAGFVYDGDAPEWIDMRIARQGELFTLLHRVDGAEEFTVLDQFIRPDLPETLNVGLTAYADWGSAAPIYPDFVAYNTQVPAQNGDLVMRVESIDFRRPTVERFPVATLDPAVSFMPEVSESRFEDLIRN